tara:strand:- start:293 stop:1942 length:1650 start_codon:yes stop_codon:yes gene_type:complete
MGSVEDASPAGDTAAEVAAADNGGGKRTLAQQLVSRALGRVYATMGPVEDASPAGDTAAEVAAADNGGGKRTSAQQLVSLAKCSHVQTQPDSSGGLGLFAAEPLRAGAEVLRCPLALALRAADAFADVRLGQPLEELRRRFRKQLDNDSHIPLLLLLMLHRALGSGSPHAAYVSSLPGEELVRSIPVFWSEEEQTERLKGTPLLSECCACASELRCLHSGLIAELGRSGEWPDGAFSWEALCWAHSVYWSRALVIDIAGKREACLLPLADMANHRPGSTAEILVEGGCYVLKLGGALEKGAEVCINYGAKGNGELLRCHGFVLPQNPAEVSAIDLRTISQECKRFDGGVIFDGRSLSEAEIQMRVGRMATEGGIKPRYFLHRGGLPPGLLKAAALLVVSSQEDVEALLTSSSEGIGNWRNCLGFLNGDTDEFADVWMLEELSPLPMQIRLNVLHVLKELLRTKLEAMLCAPKLESLLLPIEHRARLEGPGARLLPEGAFGSKAYCEAAASCYRAGQRELLMEIINLVDFKGHDEYYSMRIKDARRFYNP